MTAKDIARELGATTDTLRIERINGVAGPDLDRVRDELADNLRNPRYVAHGSTGARSITREEYLQLRDAGAHDETPWAD